MRIAINNRQKLRRPNRAGIGRLSRFLLTRITRLNPARQWGSVSLVLSDDSGIRILNRQYLRRDTTTDVMSFCYPPMPGDGGMHDGEVIVNVQRALERVQRRRGHRQWTASNELALYIAHGYDHLADQDDATPGEAARMRRRELRWLREASEEGLLDRLV